jgi:hypothetical protein
MERAVGDRRSASVMRRSVWRMMPERGTVSLFEQALLAVCAAHVAHPVPHI